eukprot:TRINITY_DN15816_c0_g1_i1.p1 TRINITY_DN15816_c0_g1~~TRINITY_DN15816_c0_g1_i1.p1  ORF type:complete len:412 (-),score=69.17 TRINITY_DN15816_c0_g1_i1:291-1526(-)
MFELLRDTLLCSNDSDEVRSARKKGGRTTGCCLSSSPSSGASARRRRAEVISTQGLPSSYVPEDPPSSFSWDQSGRRMQRNSALGRQPSRSPVRTSWSQNVDTSFHLGLPKENSFAMAGGNFRDEDGTADGIHVAWQTGETSYMPSDVQLRTAGDKSNFRQRRSWRESGQASPPTQPGPLMQAASYEAVAEDPLDRLMADFTRRLPINGAKALCIRRFGRGDYEIDGTRIKVKRQGTEAYVYLPGSEDPSETLVRYLVQAADAALARRSLPNNRGDSYHLSSAISWRPPQGQSDSFATTQSFATAPHSAAGSFTTRPPRASSPQADYLTVTQSPRTQYRHHPTSAAAAPSPRAQSPPGPSPPAQSPRQPRASVSFQFVPAPTPAAYQNLAAKGSQSFAYNGPNRIPAYGGA